MTLSRLGESRHFIQSLSSRCLPGCWTSTAAAWRHSDEPSRSVLFRSVVDVLIHRLLSVSWRRLWLRRLRSRLSVQWRLPWRKLWCGGTRLSNGVCSRLSHSLRSGNHDGIRRPGSNLLRPRPLSPVRLDCCSDPPKTRPPHFLQHYQAGCIASRSKHRNPFTGVRCFLRCPERKTRAQCHHRPVCGRRLTVKTCALNRQFAGGGHSCASVSRNPPGWFVSGGAER